MENEQKNVEIEGMPGNEKVMSDATKEEQSKDGDTLTKGKEEETSTTENVGTKDMPNVDETNETPAVPTSDAQPSNGDTSGESSQEMRVKVTQNPYDKSVTVKEVGQETPTQGGGKRSSKKNKKSKAKKSKTAKKKGAKRTKRGHSKTASKKRTTKKH